MGWCSTHHVQKPSGAFGAAFLAQYCGLALAQNALRRVRPYGLLTFEVEWKHR